MERKGILIVAEVANLSASIGTRLLVRCSRRLLKGWMDGGYQYRSSIAWVSITAYLIVDALARGKGR